MRVADLEAIRIKLASPEEVLSWSRGEVVKPETINYRTQKAEKDGLFCERIFGPEKDFECYCGKYRRIRYKGIVCDKCGVEVTKSAVRRERMGHITLATPCSHIWFLRGTPSRIGMFLDIPMPQLEKVVYFASYIITSVNEEARNNMLQAIEQEFKTKSKGQKAKEENSSTKTKSKGKSETKEKSALQNLKAAKDRAREEILGLKPLKVLSEVDYYNLSLKYGEVFEAGTGAETLRKIFEAANLKEEAEKLQAEINESTEAQQKKMQKRLRMLQAMIRSGIRPEWMFITVLPVSPPDLRPMVQLDGGRYASSDLNDLYRRVINRNNRLKYLLEINAPEVIVRNEKRMLQEAVDALIDNGMRKGQTTTATTGGKRLLKSLADMLKGKQGRFRQNLLGKRVDYSGRSVIVVGPELKLNQVGLPKKMALELFKPFVIKKLLDRELAYNIRGATRLIEDEIDEVWAALEEVVLDKVVMLNRAPTLHRLGIQAFQPILLEGEAIRIHPMVCRAFNADFDGDQMAVHVPLSDEAQKEAKNMMLSTLNLLKPATGLPVVYPTQDIALGCYFLTQAKEGAKGEGSVFGSVDEARMAYDFGQINLRAKIKVANPKNISPTKTVNENELVETTIGRIFFNEALPAKHPFVNDGIGSKKLEKIVGDVIANHESDAVEKVLDKIKEVGFEFATLSGVSWGMDDLIVPPQKPKIIEAAHQEIDKIQGYYQKGLLSSEEKTAKTIEVWQKTKSEIEKLVPEILKGNSVFTIIDSGARGSWVQPVQMAGMKGLVINPLGQIIELPVKSSYKEGLNVLEYFISTHGARKGTADTALRTSTAGYLTRRLVDVAHEVVVSEKDCGEKNGIELLREDADEIGQNFLFKIMGRVVLEDVKTENKEKGGIKVIVEKGGLIDYNQANEIAQAGIKKIKARSPLTCQTLRGVCQQCYGWDLGMNKLAPLGSAVGIVAAQAIGEPGTQLTMKTFHTGGVASSSDITSGLPRVEEVFEARIPGGKAILSKLEGTVTEITADRVVKIKTQKRNPKTKKLKSQIIEYKIPSGYGLWIKEGDEIPAGGQLCEGNLDLREVFKTAGFTVTWRYIVKEIQKIYVSQGAPIHDKHIEVIARQMFSRVRVEKGGDSIFSPGEVLEKGRLLEENNKLKKAKQTPAIESAMLLGISKVALTTDSFLSSASFQETSKVLIRAAIEGKEDRLRGLKENVIIGKLIPAGTGFKVK